MSFLASHDALFKVLVPADLTWGWQIYHAVVLCLLVFQSINLVAMMLWMVISIRRKILLRPRDVQDEVTVVVPAYLPNEAPIIGSTIAHIVSKLEGIDSMHLHVVYNSPTPLPAAEEELQAWVSATLPAGRQVSIKQVHGSQSKAENLNAILPQVHTKYVAIYDADHHPDPESLALAITHLEEHPDVDVVSGSTYIREGPLWLKWFIHADFFNFFFVQFPIFQRVARTGFFTGSNGVWRTSCFKDLTFNTAALTEDVDISIRGILNNGLKIDFLPECRSGELTPIGLRALWKQRLRWAMGWDQATLRYAPSFWRSSVASLWQKLGLYYVFVGRWILRYSASFVTLASLTQLMAARVGLGWALPGSIAPLQRIVALVNVVTIACALIQALMNEPRVSTLVSLCAYYAMLPIYTVVMCVLLTVSLSRVTTGNLGKWVVTDRPVQPANYNHPETAKKLWQGEDSTCLLQHLTGAASLELEGKVAV